MDIRDFIALIADRGYHSSCDPQHPTERDAHEIDVVRGDQVIVTFATRTLLDLNRDEVLRAIEDEERCRHRLAIEEVFDEMARRLNLERAVFGTFASDQEAQAALVEVLYLIACTGGADVLVSFYRSLEAQFLGTSAETLVLQAGAFEFREVLAQKVMNGRLLRSLYGDQAAKRIRRRVGIGATWGSYWSTEP